MTRHSKTRKLVELILIFILNSIFISYSHASFVDSANVYKTVLNVTKFNDDAVKDTIIAVADYHLKYLPKSIIWGKDTTDNGIPDSLKVPETLIIYPNWNDLTGAVMIDKLNQDSLFDIILILWGKTSTDTSNIKDTATAIVIFGRRGLDTLQYLNIANLDSFQILPFVAMKLRIGHEFTNAKVRDMSYQTSYQFNKIDLNIDTASVPPPIINIMEAEESAQIKIYPNPAVYYTDIEINLIKPGKYYIQICDINGKTLKEQTISSEKTGDLINRINLTDFASGSYIIRVFTEQKHIGSYQIILVH